MSGAYQVIDSGRDRSKWLALRRDGIGASDAAAVLGVSPWSSAMDVYAEKLGLYGPPVDLPEDDMMRWGQILEPLVLGEFRQATGRWIKREGRLLRSRARAWQQTTLDARQRRHGDRSPGLLEIKTTKFGWDEIPDDIYAQLQHQFAVSGFGWGSLAIFNRVSCAMTWQDLDRDDRYIDELNRVERDFWLRLNSGEPPDPDASEHTARALRAIFPKHIEGKVMDLDGSFIDLTDELEQAKREVAAATEQRRSLENQLKAAIGDAEAGVLPNGVMYTHRLQHRKETVQKASSFRILRRKEVK